MTTLTEKLLTYALGRGVEYYDAPAVRAIVRDAAQRRLSLLVADSSAIVQSAPFQMRGRAESERVQDHMFITKKALPRRTFLRGLGATLALPLLDAMVPALSALAQTRRPAGPSARLRLHAERRRARTSPASTTGRRPARARTSSCRRS